MLIFSLFKTLTNQRITVELKNDVAITGTLKSVDQFLNFRIENLTVIGNEVAEQEADGYMGAQAVNGGQGQGDEASRELTRKASQARWPHLVRFRGGEGAMGGVVRQWQLYFIGNH